MPSLNKFFAPSFYESIKTTKLADMIFSFEFSSRKGLGGEIVFGELGYLNFRLPSLYFNLSLSAQKK